MAWHAAINKATGEVEEFTTNPESLDGQRLRFAPLPRKPTEFDDFDGETLVLNKERKAAAARCCRTLEERVAELEDLVATLTKPPASKRTTNA